MQRLSVDPIVKVFTVLVMIMAMIFSLTLSMFLWNTSKKMFKSVNHKIEKDVV